MDAAASMIEKAIMANPTYAEAYNNLGLSISRTQSFICPSIKKKGHTVNSDEIALRCFTDSETSILDFIFSVTIFLYKFDSFSIWKQTHPPDAFAFQLFHRF